MIFGCRRQQAVFVTPLALPVVAAPLPVFTHVPVRVPVSVPVPVPTPVPVPVAVPVPTPVVKVQTSRLVFREVPVQKIVKELRVEVEKGEEITVPLQPRCFF
ncbi:unnamed protein product [Brachionus calyciflorus]|uniref:Uncharacterized protein n=1 Tax=Brachionus calyciflorus TaxID=104777 RepID=A0A814AZA1_9BILA|nr:unnamed protein product [Brachionus calyciflorus]